MVAMGSGALSEDSRQKRGGGWGRDADRGGAKLMKLMGERWCARRGKSRMSVTLPARAGGGVNRTIESYGRASTSLCAQRGAVGQGNLRGEPLCAGDPGQRNHTIAEIDVVAALGRYDIGDAVESVSARRFPMRHCDIYPIDVHHGPAFDITR